MSVPQDHILWLRTSRNRDFNEEFSKHELKMITDLPVQDQFPHLDNLLSHIDRTHHINGLAITTMKLINEKQLWTNHLTSESYQLRWIKEKQRITNFDYSQKRINAKVNKIISFWGDENWQRIALGRTPLAQLTVIANMAELCRNYGKAVRYAIGARLEKVAQKQGKYTIPYLTLSDWKLGVEAYKQDGALPDDSVLEHHLPRMYQQYLLGLPKLADSSEGLKDSSEKLRDSSEELVDSSEELRDSSEELADSSEELTDGSKELTDSSEELTDDSKELTDSSEELTDGSEEATYYPWQEGPLRHEDFVQAAPKTEPADDGAKAFKQMDFPREKGQRHQEHRSDIKTVPNTDVKAVRGQEVMDDTKKQMIIAANHKRSEESNFLARNIVKALAVLSPVKVTWKGQSMAQIKVLPESREEKGFSSSTRSLTRFRQTSSAALT